MLLESVLDRTAAEKKLNLGARVFRNFGSSEYQPDRQLSELSDGPFPGSKWPAIYEL
jgi:hypothetical protein